MPIKIKSLAGKSYRPSNGTEGDIFRARFCDRCTKDNFTDENPSGGCEILMNCLCYGIDDEEYPEEWVYNSEGSPVCTAFVARENP
jgi:hypothetical protein